MASRGAKIVVGILGASLVLRGGFAAKRYFEEHRADSPVTARERPPACNFRVAIREPKAFGAIVRAGLADPNAGAEWVAKTLGLSFGALLDAADQSKPLLVCADASGIGVAVAVAISPQAFDSVTANLAHRRSTLLGRQVYEGSGGQRFALFGAVAVMGETPRALDEFGPYVGFAAATAPAHAVEVWASKTFFSAARASAPALAPLPANADVEARVNAAVQAHAAEFGELALEADVVGERIFVRLRLGLSGESRAFVEGLPIVPATSVRALNPEKAEIVTTLPVASELTAFLQTTISEALTPTPQAFAKEFARVGEGLGSHGGTSLFGGEMVLRAPITDEAKVRAGLKLLRDRFEKGLVHDEHIGEIAVTSFRGSGTVCRWVITDGALWVAWAATSATGYLETVLTTKPRPLAKELLPTLEAPSLRAYARNADAEAVARFDGGVLELAVLATVPATVEVVKALGTMPPPTTAP